MRPSVLLVLACTVRRLTPPSSRTHLPALAALGATANQPLLRSQHRPQALRAAGEQSQTDAAHAAAIKNAAAEALRRFRQPAAKLDDKGPETFRARAHDLQEGGAAPSRPEMASSLQRARLEAAEDRCVALERTVESLRAELEQQPAVRER